MQTPLLQSEAVRTAGNLSSATTNGYIGGILGVDGFMRTPTEVSDCENSGDISFTKSWGDGRRRSEDRK